MDTNHADVSTKLGWKGLMTYLTKPYFMYFFVITKPNQMGRNAVNYNNPKTY